jgi:TolB-like protein/Flp pilus assembly protein TadD
MTDVFLSYKREDVAKARKLVEALRSNGLEVWWDQDISPGAPWEATIEQELARAKVVVVCWSPASVDSENVRSEARRARRDDRLIQVFLRQCEPPLFFGERQGVDLSSWRGKPDDARVAKIAQSVRDAAAGKRIDVPDPSKAQRWFDRRIHLMAVVVVLLAGSLAGWWLLSPAKAQGPMTLAVLPFRALNPADGALVDAIWDDTRGAIGRNPNLRVLGREAVEALAKKDLDPGDYRKKVGADYLLDGSVQHVGDQVRMKLSLTRTTDAAEVWSDEIGGKLDDVFAFQQRIAREVEGRIRGRVAPGGGVSARNITTSGEVYSLYAEARALILKRGNGQGGMGRARELLKRAVAIDPNYAPAWTELGVSTGIGASPQQTQEAIGYVKRALQLAPNLAHAHAALAMVQSSPPELEGELKKAVTLDPNDFEAWMWLGNRYNAQNRYRDALAAYSRAVEINPLFLPGIGNKLGALAALGNQRGLEDELRRVEAAGDPVLLEKVRAGILSATGRPGDAVRVLLALRAKYGDQSGWIDNHVAPFLLQLGFIEEGVRLAHFDPAAAAVYRGNAGPPGTLLLGYPRPVDFWQDFDAPAVMGRLLVRGGRTHEYAAAFHKAFKRPEDYEASLSDRQLFFVRAAPTVALTLAAGGDGVSANTVLARADATTSTWLRNGPPTPDLLALVSHVRGAQGRDVEALSFLKRAVAGGWLPDRTFYAVDIADEPCFARLIKLPEFQAVRQHLLQRIEEERRKVPAAMVAQAYPVKRALAA